MVLKIRMYTYLYINKYVLYCIIQVYILCCLSPLRARELPHRAFPFWLCLARSRSFFWYALCIFNFSVTVFCLRWLSAYMCALYVAWLCVCKCFSILLTFDCFLKYFYQDFLFVVLYVYFKYIHIDIN